MISIHNGKYFLDAYNYAEVFLLLTIWNISTPFSVSLVLLSSLLFSYFTDPGSPLLIRPQERHHCRQIFFPFKMENVFLRRHSNNRGFPPNRIMAGSHLRKLCVVCGEDMGRQYAIRAPVECRGQRPCGRGHEGPHRFHVVKRIPLSINGEGFLAIDVTHIHIESSGKKEEGRTNNTVAYRRTRR